MTPLEYRAVSGVGLPALLAAFGIFGKKLARGVQGSWKRSDFYLGVEFTLAAVSAALINILDALIKPSSETKALERGMLLGNIGVSILGLFLFMFVLTMHQDYENEKNVDAARNKELKALAGVCNVIGFGMLVAGIALMAD
jgi:hypothetical protein